MTGLRETVEERASLPPDPAPFLRQESTAGDEVEFWSPGLFQAALAAGAIEPLAGLSELARTWRPHFEARPGWNPGLELRDLILASDNLTLRDKRHFEKFWTLAGRLAPEKLAREVRPVLDHIEPEDDGERAWRDLLGMVVKDVRKLFGKRKLSIIVNPDDAPFVPLVLDAVLAYLRATLALDRLREERIRFMVQRYSQLQRISGFIDGPGDLADRHTDYAAPRPR